MGIKIDVGIYRHGTPIFVVTETKYFFYKTKNKKSGRETPCEEASLNLLLEQG